MLLPLQGARQTALILRVLPWDRSFCPFRACGQGSSGRSGGSDGFGIKMRLSTLSASRK